MVPWCSFSGQCKAGWVPRAPWPRSEESQSCWGALLSQSCDIWLPAATASSHTSEVRAAESRQAGLGLTPAAAGPGPGISAAGGEGTGTRDSLLLIGLTAQPAGRTVFIYSLSCDEQTERYACSSRADTVLTLSGSSCPTRTIQHKNFLFTITSESVLARIRNDLRPQSGLIRNLSSWKCDLLLPEGYKNTSNNG